MTIKMEGQATLPYPDPDGTLTGGHSGSDASRERARSEAANGTTRDRQKTVLLLLDRKKDHGLTVADLRRITGWHHGQASSALSLLHKSGRIERLEWQRGRCHVYVLREFVNDRVTQPFGRKSPVTGGTLPTQADLEKAKQGGYDLGYTVGRTDGAVDAERDVLLFIDRIVGAIKINGRVQTHHSGCYRDHPQCALRAVSNFISKSGAMT